MIPTNSRRFPPCLPQSSPPAESSSSEASASASSPSGISDALKDAESYRRSAIRLTRAQRATVTLANAFNKQRDDFGVDRLLAVIDATRDQAEHCDRLQHLVDLVLAEWDASNSFVFADFARARRALNEGIAAYRAEVQA